MRYRLTESAKQDIRDATNHIRTVQRSPQNARVVAERLKQQFNRLTRAPLIGHVRRELDDEHARVIEVTGLLVIYDPHLKPLTILRVVHPSRDLARVQPRR